MRLPRYLAIVGQRDPFGIRTSLGLAMTEFGLRQLFTAPGLTVYGDGPAPLAIGEAQGIVLGTIFHREAPMHAVRALDDAEAGDVLAARGKVLIDRFWGDYLAFIAGAGTGEAIVMRPPLGDLTCLYARHRGLVLAASDLELLGACGVETREIDWSEIASHLRNAGLKSNATSLRGINEVLWSNRMTVRGGDLTIAPCWCPWTFALAPDARTPEDIAEELRALTMACVHAQVRHLGAIDIMISGGLDSSILAASLAKTGVPTTCLNFPFAGANGDERIYARAVAAHLGLPLFEVEPKVADVDVTLCDDPWLARPINRAFAQPMRQAKYRLAAVTGAADFVDGGGGDSLFCSMQSVAPVADRILRHGIGPGAIRTAADVARLTDASLLQVFALGLRRAYLRRRAHRWPIDEQFLSREAIERAGKRRHPWLRTRRGAVPGSAAHIANMVVVENLIEIANGPPAEWSPLMTQPLVEFCLSVPSWLWFENGHNRAIARRAFAPLLPPGIAWRRDKGSPDAFAAAIFEANREILGSFLVGGRLDQAGLLDTEALRDALAPDRPVKGFDYNRVLRIADVEAWVRARGDTPPASTANCS